MSFMWLLHSYQTNGVKLIYKRALLSGLLVFDIFSPKRIIIAVLIDTRKIFFSIPLKSFLLHLQPIVIKCLCDDSLNHYQLLTTTIQLMILGLRPANERRRYLVTTSLIGWMQA